MSKAPLQSIHCIGDSHISLFAGDDSIQPIWPKRSRDQLPWFRSYHIGPALAYNLTRDGTNSQGREKLFQVIDQEVPEAAIVLLCFGEIDCRVHLVKQSQQKNLAPIDVVDACLDEYFKLVAHLLERGFRVIVYNAVASWPKARAFRQRERDGYATFGTREERLEMIRLFNTGAKKRCASCGALFLENEPHITAGGKPRGWFFFDSIHLSQKAMPPTLMELTKLLPELEIDVPVWREPSLMVRLADWFAGRRKRVLKELGKLGK